MNATLSIASAEYPGISMLVLALFHIPPRVRSLVLSSFFPFTHDCSLDLLYSVGFLLYSVGFLLEDLLIDEI